MLMLNGYSYVLDLLLQAVHRHNLQLLYDITPYLLICKCTSVCDKNTISESIITITRVKTEKCSIPITENNTHDQT